jgi:hypothetical protein
MSSLHEIIIQIERAHAEWTGLILELTPEEMTKPGPPERGGWSVKEIVAHIAVYQEWLGEFISNRDWPVSPPHLNSPDTDTRNAAFRLEYRDTSLADVLELASQAHRTLVAAIATMTEEDFADGTRLGFPPGPEWDPRRLILANTVEHYAAHAGAVRELQGATLD